MDRRHRCRGLLRRLRRRWYVRAALLLVSLTATAVLGYAAGSGLLAEVTGWDVRPLLGHDAPGADAPADGWQLSAVEQCRDFLSRYWWWLAAPLAPAAVLALSLVCFRNVPLPVFFLISLMIHAVPAVGMVYFLDETWGVPEARKTGQGAGQGSEDDSADVPQVAWLPDAPEVFEAMPLDYAELTQLTSIETIGALDALRRPNDLVELPRPLERFMAPFEPTPPALRPSEEAAGASERSADLPATPAVTAADPPLLPRAAAGPAIDARPVATLAPTAAAPVAEQLPAPAAVSVTQWKPDAQAREGAAIPSLAIPALALRASVAPQSSQPSRQPDAARAPVVHMPLEEPAVRVRASAGTPQRVEAIALAAAAPAGPIAGGGRLPGAEVSVVRQPTTAGTPELVLPAGGVPSRWIARDGSSGAGQGGPRLALVNSEPGRVGPDGAGQNAPVRSSSRSVVAPIPVELPRGTAPAAGASSGNANSGNGDLTIKPVEIAVARAGGRTGASDIRPSLLPAAGQGRGPGMGAAGREGPLPLPTFGRELAASSRPAGGTLARVLARENIKLEHALDLRQADVKDDALIALGGSRESREAVRRGIEWLKRHQHADGHWSLEKFYNELPGKSYTGKGSVASDTAATGFGLLPLLGDGHTHLSGEHQEAVRRGVQWLAANQKKDGELNVRAGSNTRMYAHAVATIALCEAFGMTKDAALREPAQRAVAFIVESQDQSRGGWRYDPKSDSDTSVLGWQVMALKSGQMAGLDVPPRTFDLVGQYLGRVEGKGKEYGQFRYRPNEQFTPAMAAEGLLCVQYLGAGRDDPRLQAGVKYLLSHLPRRGGETSYYWYYGTQVLYHLQGEPWKQWNAVLRDMLVATQLKDGHLAGTWDPKDQWEQRGGRLYATSLRLLMLEVYYRHLPLYRVYGQ